MFFGTASTSASASQSNQKELRDGKGRHTPLGHLNQEELLTLLGLGYMRRNERVLKGARSGLEAKQISNQTYHERFKIGSPPLSKTVSNFPFVVDTM